MGNTFIEAYGKKHYLAWCKRIIAIIALGCFGYFGWSARDSLDIVLNSAVGSLLFVTFLLLIIRNILQIIPTVYILNGLGFNVPWMIVFKISIMRLPARYIPGGVWHSVAQVVDLRNYGVSMDVLSGMLSLQQVMAIGSAMILGGVGLALFQQDHQWIYYGYGTACLALVSVWLLSYLVILMIKRRGFFPQKKSIVQAFSLSVISWFVPAVAFIFLIYSFPKADITASALQIGSIFLFSRGVGFLAIFAPQGIGVFEYVAAALLPSSYEVTSIGVILLSFRLVGFLADLATYGIFFISCKIPAVKTFFSD